MCKEQYHIFEDALGLAKETRRNAQMAKTDIEYAFRLLLLDPENFTNHSLDCKFFGTGSTLKNNISHNVLVLYTVGKHMQTTGERKQQTC